MGEIPLMTELVLLLLMVLNVLSCHNYIVHLVYFLNMIKVKRIHQVNYYILHGLFLIVVHGLILNLIQKIACLYVLIDVENYLQPLLLRALGYTAEEILEHFFENNTIPFERVMNSY